MIWGAHKPVCWFNTQQSFPVFFQITILRIKSQGSAISTFSTSGFGPFFVIFRHLSVLSMVEILQSKKSPTGPTERTPKPGYLITRSQLTERGPLVRSYSIFDGFSCSKVVYSIIHNMHLRIPGAANIQPSTVCFPIFSYILFTSLPSHS